MATGSSSEIGSAVMRVLRDAGVEVEGGSDDKITAASVLVGVAAALVAHGSRSQAETDDNVASMQQMLAKQVEAIQRDLVLYPLPTQQ